jgi:hypothetical protein
MAGVLDPRPTLSLEGRGGSFLHHFGGAGACSFAEGRRAPAGELKPHLGPCQALR